MNSQTSPQLLLLGASEPATAPADLNVQPQCSAPAVDIEALLREADDDAEWWQDAENQSAIITRQQLATAVYLASRGDICIRQENRDPIEDDVCVFIRPEHVPALIRRLQATLKE